MVLNQRVCASVPARVSTRIVTGVFDSCSPPLPVPVLVAPRPHAASGPSAPAPARAALARINDRRVEPPPLPSWPTICLSFAQPRHAFSGRSHRRGRPSVLRGPQGEQSRAAAQGPFQGGRWHARHRALLLSLALQVGRWGVVVGPFHS